MEETFSFGDVDYEHVVGDSSCRACWSYEIGPHDCEIEGCLEHDQFGDENWDGYWLYHLGDLCRE
jgi:hypothetical protein